MERERERESLGVGENNKTTPFTLKPMDVPSASYL
jgi:hypothetical protein